jgi:Na+-driven multidrug efflux pump
MIATASGEREDPNDEKDHLATAVSSALLLALLLGTVQALVFFIGARRILGAAGIHYAAEMYTPAMSFMRARALSAPTSTLWLVATNVFRGLGDATTPMLCAILFNVVNMLGDYVLIEKVKVGIAGTALGTTIAQFVALIPLLTVLNQRVPFWMNINLKSFRRYLSRYGKAGIYLIGRSVARIAAVSYISRRSVRAAHIAHLTFWFDEFANIDLLSLFFLFKGLVWFRGG